MPGHRALLTQGSDHAATAEIGERFQAVREVVGGRPLRTQKLQAVGELVLVHDQHIDQAQRIHAQRRSRRVVHHRLQSRCFGPRQHQQGLRHGQLHLHQQHVVLAKIRIADLLSSRQRVGTRGHDDLIRAVCTECHARAAGECIHARHATHVHTRLQHTTQSHIGERIFAHRAHQRHLCARECCRMRLVSAFATCDEQAVLSQQGLTLTWQRGAAQHQIDVDGAKDKQHDYDLAMPLSQHLIDAIHAMPKVELHCHLLGSLRKETFLHFAKRAAKAEFRTAQGISEEEVAAFYTRGEKPVGVLKALRALDAELIREPSDLHRIAYEYLRDAAAHQVRYAEVFWNPTGTARDSGIAYPAALDALCTAFADAENDCGVVGRLIPAIDREASPAAAQEMLGWVLAHRRPEVIGIGMDYREVDRPPEFFTQTYLDAKHAGLKTTCHAGEFGMPWVNVRTAVDVLQVDRIDHGYTVVDGVKQGDPGCIDLLKRCRDKGIVFTVVPTNSYYLRTSSKERWALDHPIRQMQALADIGIAIHPNTDDPTLHHVTPSQAWAMMLEHFGYGVADMRHWLVNGLNAAWIDEGTRRKWLNEDLAVFDGLVTARH